MSKVGKVYLVGAGCGAFDLITLRGLNILQSCDTLVYDSLIDTRLLDLAHEKSEKIGVGKRAGRHSETQENINRILVEKALEGKNVVRLKGGDPFVFGRGGEEIIALQEMGIPYSVIPGISSAIAVPELAGIPVTHRRMSRSFHVITGHTADDMLPDKLQYYAKLDGTLVFLMGLKNLREIAGGLMSGGMNGNTPAAIISCGATSRQRVIKCTLDSIAYLAERENACSPAVIVVGETVRLDFPATIAKPLDGVSVSVTGTKRFCEKLSGRLGSLGAEVHCRCRLNVTEYGDNARLKAAVQQIDEYSWLVFTSTNGAEIFFEHLKKSKTDIRSLRDIKVAAIGRGTAKALENKGIFTELVPNEYTSAALGKSLAGVTSKDEKILIIRAEKGSPELTRPLNEAGIKYDDIKTYDVKSADENMPEEVSNDYLVFGSASGVHAFFECGYSVSEDTKIVCIGPSAAETLTDYGINNYLICDNYCIDGIVNKIISEEQK